MIPQVRLVPRQSLAFDISVIVTRCPINKLFVCIEHIATFGDPIPETNWLSKSQSFDSYRSWDVEKNNACEIQNGTRRPSDDAANENPAPVRPQVSMHHLVSFLSKSLFLKRWVGGSVEVVVAIKERNIQGGGNRSTQCGSATA